MTHHEPRSPLLDLLGFIIFLVTICLAFWGWF